MGDWLKISLWLGIALILVGLLCLGAVAWNNSGSRNLALATGTLFAAIVLFLVQLPFELRSSSSADIFTAQLTVDRLTPIIRMWKYPDWPGAAVDRLMQEVAASSDLAAHDRSRFDGDRDRLTLDLILYDLIAYLGVEQFDWRVKKTHLRGTRFEFLFPDEPLARDAGCTTLHC